MAEARVLHRGWLIKDPPATSIAFSRSRRRFFVLTDDGLEWFVDDSDIRAVPHGRVLIDETTSLAVRRSSYSSEGCIGRWADQELEIITRGEGIVVRSDDDGGVGAWEAALRSRLERGDLRSRLAAALDRERAADKKARASAPVAVTVPGKLVEGVGEPSHATDAEERAAAAERRVEALEAQLRSLQVVPEGCL